MPVTVQSVTLTPPAGGTSINCGTSFTMTLNVTYTAGGFGGLWYIVAVVHEKTGPGDQGPVTLYNHTFDVGDTAGLAVTKPLTVNLQCAGTPCVVTRGSKSARTNPARLIGFAHPQASLGSTKNSSPVTITCITPSAGPVVPPTPPCPLPAVRKQYPSPEMVTEKEEETMKEFRDKVLLKNPAYSKLVDIYYNHGDELVKLCGESEELKTIIPKAFRVFFNITQKSLDQRYSGVLVEENEAKIIGRVFDLLAEHGSQKLKDNSLVAKKEFFLIVGKDKSQLAREKSIDL